jgi:Enoyl-(Acyl carrier protein) reductase
VSRLVDKVCVVNGAASKIGQAVAERFASEGALVVGVDKVEHSIGEHVVQADLVDESQVEAMYEQVVRSYGRLDVIYNNMGLMDRDDRSALDTSLETWRRVHDANLTSIFLSCKHGVRHQDAAPLAPRTRATQVDLPEGAPAWPVTDRRRGRRAGAAHGQGEPTMGLRQDLRGAAQARDPGGCHDHQDAAATTRSRPGAATLRTDLGAVPASAGRGVGDGPSQTRRGSPSRPGMPRWT